jgi:hypothetical protein
MREGYYDENVHSRLYKQRLCERTIKRKSFPLFGGQNSMVNSTKNLVTTIKGKGEIQVNHRKSLLFYHDNPNTFSNLQSSKKRKQRRSAPLNKITN